MVDTIKDLRIQKSIFPFHLPPETFDQMKIKKAKLIWLKNLCKFIPNRRYTFCVFGDENENFINALKVDYRYQIRDQQHRKPKKKKKSKEKLFFQMIVLTRFVKNECRYNKIMKFEFKFVISDFENH